MEPGLDPHMHRRVQADLLRAPQPSVREKTRDRKIQIFHSGRKDSFIRILLKWYDTRKSFTFDHPLLLPRCLACRHCCRWC